MTVSVAAVVVAHSADVYLSETLSQLSKQLFALEQVVVVDTASSNETLKLVSQFGFAIVQPGDLRLGAAIEVGVRALRSKPQWLWILHDDSAPEPNALSQLAKMAEVSESVAIIGPKLLRWDLPVEIQQLGLTATPTGKPFLLVESEFDQGQFDVRTDTLAVSTAGMLVGLAVWEKLGGLDDSSPTLAQDIEFSLRARAAGFRVVVEPSAKVLHAGLAMSGKRSRRWLGGGYRSAIAKAHLHLFGLIAPRGILPLVYVCLPLLALLSIPYGILQRHPSRIVGSFSAWLWGWATLGSRFGARSRFRKLGSITAAKKLMATRKQIRYKQSRQWEFPPEQAKLGGKGFFTSGAFYTAALLPVLSLASFPLAALLSTGSPIGRSFESIWAATGVDVVQYLDGVAFPADPFNWFYALLALVPASPSLVLNWFVFLASSLAFLASWLLLGELTKRPWLRHLASATYALSPAVLSLQSAAAVIELTVVIFVPLSLYFLLKTKSAFNSARALRWGALSGLSLAMVGIANPIVFGLLAVVVVGLAASNIRRAVLMLLALLPALALLLPWFIATSSKNLALFALTSSNRSELPNFVIWYLASLGLLVVIAAALGHSALSLSVAVFTGALLALERALGLSFAEVTGLMVLGSVALLVEILQKLKPRQLRIALAAALSAGLAASAAVFGFLANRPLQGEDLSAPALVVAQADAQASTRTLVIRFNQAIYADLIWGDGRSADERSVLYSALSADSDLERPLAELTAQLVAANPAAVGDILTQLGIDFVLVVGSDPVALATKASVSGMEYFQVAGESDFGSLFRVIGAKDQPAVEILATNRDWQLAVLAIFTVLAIPTPGAIRGYRRKVAK